MGSVTAARVAVPTLLYEEPADSRVRLDPLDPNFSRHAGRVLLRRRDRCRSTPAHPQGQGRRGRRLRVGVVPRLRLFPGRFRTPPRASADDASTTTDMRRLLDDVRRRNAESGNQRPRGREAMRGGAEDVLAAQSPRPSRLLVAMLRAGAK